jgi:GNAT superfamily N-acetyltransferase
MIIRKAETSDISTIAEFNQAMALETEGKALSADRLFSGVAAVFDDANKGFYIVAECEGSPAGCLLITREWSDWRNGWFWWIQSVYVSPKYRGRGIYPKMYEFVKTLAEAERDVCGFRLYVERENHRARRVYEKLGMHESHYLMYEEEIAK